MILSVLLLFSCTLTPFGQDFWEQLSIPDSIEIMCFTTNNQGHHFIGAKNDGNPGGVYRSVDNAQTWELVLDAGTFTVQTIAINEDGYIYRQNRL